MKSKNIQKYKDEIDRLSHYDMAYLHRNAKSSHPYFITPELGKHFIRRFADLGGMTTEISKQVGWEH